MIRSRRDLWSFAFATFLLSWPQVLHFGSAHEGPQRRGEAELLAIHQADRVAHFKHDIPALLRHVGPRLVDIRDGKINRMTRPEVEKRFAEYFQHVDFSAWDDLEPPIVHVSEDGRLGWMVVRVRIAYSETTEKGQKLASDSTMAWMSAYERLGSDWMLTAVTSTSTPP